MSEQLSDEWITTKRAAELLKLSVRHVRELARKGKLKAKRDGKNWLIHSSLSRETGEAASAPNGIPGEVSAEAYEKLEQMIQYLQNQIAEKDKQLERQQTITMQLSRDIESQQKLIEYQGSPWWRRWFFKTRKDERG